MVEHGGLVLETVGWAGSAILVWSMMQRGMRRLRLFGLVGCLAQVVYNGSLAVWPVVALNVVIAAVHVVYLVRPAEVHSAVGLGNPPDKGLAKQQE